MLQEYDTVLAQRDITDNVLKGCKGTIVMVHGGSPPDYEVEFVNESLETIDVLTVNSKDVILIKSVV